MLIYEDLEFLTPYMHTMNDVVGLSLNCPPLLEANARLAAAGVATLAGVSSLIELAAFRRGDFNADSARDIADAIGILAYLFASGAASPCGDAADANDDGLIDISDAIALLRHLFGGEGPLPAPFEACGMDPTADKLGCKAFAPCAS